MDFFSIRSHVPVIIMEIISATGTECHTTSIPRKPGRIITAGIKNSTCLEIVIISAGSSFPIAWKNPVLY
jgi:hypothetical protein